ncbi:MAG: ferredoxin [Acidimicrobiia bacterium]|nr:ferredoxin [Acidimicrobiia bacterium]
MKVWIGQDHGSRLREEIAHDVSFGPADDRYYVKKPAENFGAQKTLAGTANPAGSDGFARIPDGALERVIESAEE